MNPIDLITGDDTDNIYLDELMGDNPAASSGGDDGTPAANNPPTGDAAQDNNKSPQVEESGQQTEQDTTDQNKQSGETSKEPPTANIRRLPSGDLVDSKNNIVDEKGTIIAHAGTHRRLYESNRTLKAQLSDATTRLTKMQEEINTNRLLNGKANELGLTAPEVQEALDIASRLRSGDYLGVTKDLIAKIIAKGHNVTELLGKDVGDSLDFRALNKMLDERLAPVVQPAQQQQQLAEVTQEAVKQYNEFVSTHAYADVHANALGRMVIAARQRGEALTPSQAYAHLVNYARDHGLDFTQDLGPQLEARKQAAGARLIEEMQKRNNTAPLPGNGATTRMSGVSEPTKPMADGDETFADIIRQSMAESNYR